MTDRSVWYVSKYVSPPEGSAEGSRGYELMKELADRGVGCTVVTSDANHLAAHLPRLHRSKMVELRDGLTLCWLRTMKASDAKSIRRIVSWLHFEWALFRLDKSALARPDVVIVSSLSLLTILNGLLLRRRFRCRLVFEVRDIWPLTLTAEGGFSRRNPLVAFLALVERIGYQRADSIVGTMPNLGEHVANVVGRQLPVTCIPMGFAPRTLKSADPGPRTDAVNDGRRRAFVIGYAGTVGITNALEPLFEAASHLRTEPYFQFVVVGDGGLAQRYRALYGHLPNLRFVGRVPRTDVGQILSTCDLLYLSTHASEVWRYGQSLNKLIDYMLAAKPILASYTGFPSMIDEADCGTFVPASDVDALVREIRRYAEKTDAERRELGENGRQWLLENRNYSKLANQYDQLLFGEGAQLQQ